MFEGRAAIGYDHGYNAQKFYLGLALDPKYIEGFVEGWLERIGEYEPEDEDLFRDLWEDETLYWMATITNADTAGVNKTVMVNSAEQGEVTVLESYEDVMAFVEGEDTGRTVEVEEDGAAGESGEPSDTPENETPEEQPAQSSAPQSPSDVSDMSEEELIRVIREAANELESRKEE